MLVNIQTFVLDTGRNTEPVQFLDTIEENNTAGSSPKVDDEHTEALGTEEPPTMTIEGTIAGRKQSREQGAQDAADTVNRACAYWVVDVQTVVDELDGEYQYRTANKADDDGSQRRDEVATGCDANKARQHSVQSQ